MTQLLNSEFAMFAGTPRFSHTMTQHDSFDGKPSRIFCISLLTYHTAGTNPFTPAQPLPSTPKREWKALEETPPSTPKRNPAQATEEVEGDVLAMALKEYRDAERLLNIVQEEATQKRHRASLDRPLLPDPTFALAHKQFVRAKRVLAYIQEMVQKSSGANSPTAKSATPILRSPTPQSSQPSGGVEAVLNPTSLAGMKSTRHKNQMTASQQSTGVRPTPQPLQASGSLRPAQDPASLTGMPPTTPNRKQPATPQPLTGHLTSPRPNRRHYVVVRGRHTGVYSSW